MWFLEPIENSLKLCCSENVLILEWSQSASASHGPPRCSVTQRLWWTFRNWGDGAREGEYWIAYSEYAKPQQNRQVNNAHFLLVWGTFPTMTVLLCGLLGSALSRDQDFGISLSWISLFILVLWPWVHGAGVGSCLCRSEYLKLNNQRIPGHVVIWYWGQLCGIFFFLSNFLVCLSFCSEFTFAVCTGKKHLERDLLQS